MASYLKYDIYNGFEELPFCYFHKVAYQAIDGIAEKCYSGIRNQGKEGWVPMINKMSLYLCESLSLSLEERYGLVVVHTDKDVGSRGEP